MLHLNLQGLQDREGWEAAGIALPRYDAAAVKARTRLRPVWVHFGAGNIFRGFLAALQQTLLNAGLTDTGILAAESFDVQIIDKVYDPYDDLSLLVRLRADGSYEKEVVASVARGLKADCTGGEWADLVQVFQSPGLQLASFTITEKGYALTDLSGKALPVAEHDFAAGPDAPRHTMSIAAALLYRRFQAGGHPIAMVSMDNCSQNGKKLREGVFAAAQAWKKAGFVSDAFLEWLSDETNVTFPWSMIDKITPHPSETVQAALEKLGVEGMNIFQTNTGTRIAPFVNAEITEYLVLEDAFPNGRPPLEKAGVYFADRATVEKAEKMKVGTCLNPLHTALAVYGCLLGYSSIAAEMADPDLKALVEHIAAEGLKVVEDPGILSPRKFIDEVLNERFPNPAIPDTPQRIAADTSQKLPVRYGGTLQRYVRRPDLDVSSLVYAPLVFAGWCRYLLGVDDQGGEMPVSPDPMAPQLRALLAGIEAGRPETCSDQLRPILSNAAIFGVDLYQAGLGEKTEAAFRAMLAGPGAVRATLRRYLSERA
ncbi:mannitol dehydrogenase family protein [Lawsonibacter sp.]|uniref:mannitol dehydrogenase family protein n=1 Tax=Lawsonibacter sp. TaxID=2185275 RepID=UPI00258773F1|nr:mannitol dehydrogenase family protein [Lawsonibacter sp.]MCI6399989.1 mannitol dehydrogenase family protein [Lawsonibacter sp.]MDY2976785.1 mannitol dehydrogenase family protein [Oscillospiraceae bacterium]